MLWVMGCAGATPAAEEGQGAGVSGTEVPAGSANGAAGEEGDDPAAVVRLRAPVTAHQPARGPEDALVTIVVISDFQCPFCARAAATLDELTRTYGKDLRIVWRNYPLPFHPQAEPAAHATLEAFAQGGSAMFWRMHDLVFSEQANLSRETLLALGKRAGMDLNALSAAIDERKHESRIDADRAMADRLGLRGTPAFLVNGRQLMGAQPYEVFHRLVEDELARARRLVAGGVPRANLYAHLMKEARDGPPPPAPRHAEPLPQERYELAVPDRAPRLGPADAPVVIQIFSDFECPFCARAVPTLQQIRREYGGKVALVFRHYPLPFHRNARLAHQASLEVYRQGGDEKFWAFHDLLFESRDLDRSDLERQAETLGDIDMEAFRRALDRAAHDDTIQADMKAADDTGARIGTPSFFINDVLVQGARSIEQFRQVIDGELD
jgi:protein-disulfide isomerase